MSFYLFLYKYYELSNLSNSKSISSKESIPVSNSNICAPSINLFSTKIFRFFSDEKKFEVIDKATKALKYWKLFQL
jgi:hypothetical protein